MKRCLDCGRPLASEADWHAFAASDAGSCNREDCAWGGDRCWYVHGCGSSRPGVEELAGAGRALRGGRPLARVPHEHPVVTQ